MKDTLEVIKEMFQFDINQDQMPIHLQGDRRIDLPRIFKNSGFTNGAEIGVWEGEYSRTLVRRVPNLHLYCIDPWKSYGDFHETCNDDAIMEAAYEKTKEELKGRNVTIFRCESKDAVLNVPDGSLDFVFIDGNHNLPYTIADLHTWIPKVRKGGIISGHDYLVKRYPPSDIHVKIAINAWTDAYLIRPWFLLVRSRWPTWFWIKG